MIESNMKINNSNRNGNEKFKPQNLNPRQHPNPKIKIQKPEITNEMAKIQTLLPEIKILGSLFASSFLIPGFYIFFCFILVCFLGFKFWGFEFLISISVIDFHSSVLKFSAFFQPLGFSQSFGFCSKIYGKSRHICNLFKKDCPKEKRFKVDCHFCHT